MGFMRYVLWDFMRFIQDIFEFDIHGTNLEDERDFLKPPPTRH